MLFQRIIRLLTGELSRYGSWAWPDCDNDSFYQNAADRGRYEQEECHIRRHLAPGQAVEITGINGSIWADIASGDNLQVVAVKKSLGGNPADVVIEVVEHSGGVTVRAVCPDTGLGVWRGRPERRRRNYNNDVQVDFRVFIPSGARLIARLLNGQINTLPLQSDINAQIVNGELNISSFRAVEAVTVNGAIVVSVGETDVANPIVCRAVNGCITLKLPSQPDAEVQARTLNGNISTDFPLTVQGQFNSNWVNGMIGSGGRKLTLETNNGSIELRRTT